MVGGRLPGGACSRVSTRVATPIGTVWLDGVTSRPVPTIRTWPLPRSDWAMSTRAARRTPSTPSQPRREKRGASARACGPARTRPEVALPITVAFRSSAKGDLSTYICRETWKPVGRRERPRKREAGSGVRTQRGGRSSIPWPSRDRSRSGWIGRSEQRERGESKTRGGQHCGQHPRAAGTDGRTPVAPASAFSCWSLFYKSIPESLPIVEPLLIYVARRDCMSGGAEGLREREAGPAGKARRLPGRGSTSTPSSTSPPRSRSRCLRSCAIAGPRLLFCAFENSEGSATPSRPSQCSSCRREFCVRYRNRANPSNSAFSSFVGSPAISLSRDRFFSPDKVRRERFFLTPQRKISEVGS